MSNRYADLHIHTDKSDSTFTVEEVIRQASQHELSAIAITDHDSVEAVEVAKELAKPLGIEVIPGVELSTEIDEEEVHILGYFVDCNNEEFLSKLSFLRNARVERARKIIEKLNQLNINLTMDEVMGLTGSASVGRMHIARLLYEKHYISSINEAFWKFLGRGKHAYIKKYLMSPEDAIILIRSLGGIPVLAHPQILNRDEMIPKMAESGLQGIEVYHTDHTPAGVNKYLKIADKHNLLVTGGSDCHGIGKGRVLMGTIKIPYELVEKMKIRRDAINRVSTTDNA